MDRRTPTAGTKLALPSWAAISYALARALRLLVLVTLFLGGSTSHEFAMAGDVETHASMMHNAHTMDHDAPHDACGRGRPATSTPAAAVSWASAC